MRVRQVLALAALTLLAAGPVPVRAQGTTVTLKIATLAPKGSAWAKIMDQGAKDIAAASGGRVKIRYFFGGQQGDEKDFIAKINLGQLDGAAVTAVGLALIQPDALVFQLPMLFRNNKELDYVRTQMEPYFEQAFQQKGFKLLMWGDIGWIHIFSNVPITSKADLGKTKMWVWADDPMQREFLTGLGANGVPLGVPDVLPNLQTGVIDACYGSPLSAVALQWYSKITYATETPTGYGVGAMVVRLDVWNTLSPADQQAILKISAEMGVKFLKNVRRDDKRSKKAMKAAGITFTPTPKALIADFETEAKRVKKHFTGKLFSAQLIADVEKHLADVRGSGGGKKKRTP